MTDKTPRRHSVFDGAAPGASSTDIWKGMGFSRDYGSRALVPLVLGLRFSVSTVGDLVREKNYADFAAGTGYVEFYCQWNRLFPKWMTLVGGKLHFDEVSGPVSRKDFLDYVEERTSSAAKLEGECKLNHLRSVDAVVRGGKGFGLHMPTKVLEEWSEFYTLGRKAYSLEGNPLLPEPASDTPPPEPDKSDPPTLETVGKMIADALAYLERLPPIVREMTIDIARRLYEKESEGKRE